MQDRTEAPTPQRRAQARAEGRLAASALASAWFALAFSAMIAGVAITAAGSWVELWRASAERGSVLARGGPLGDAAAVLGGWSAWKAGWFIALTVASASLTAAILAAGVSGTLAFAPAALSPRLDRLSWSAGARQLVNPGGAIHALAGFFTVAIVFCCAWPALRAFERMSAAGMTPTGTAIAFGHILRSLWLSLIIALAAPVCFDVWQARRRSIRALRMTPREVREERAEHEGRPELRARRRAHAASSLRDIRIGAIRRATAVVTNPEHIAVALRYAPPQVDVPIVVSRGADLAAALVRAIAVAHDVPIVESPELARTLYVSVALGEPIPEECYAAVAAVFAWLLRTRGILQGADEA